MSQQSDDELNLNEGVIYTAGGIGLRTQVQQSHANATANKKVKSLNQKTIKLNRTSSIASLGLNDRASVDGGTSHNQSQLQDQRTILKYEPLISQISISSMNNINNTLTTLANNPPKNHNYIPYNQRKNLRRTLNM